MMEKASKRSLRNGCKYCGYGKDGQPVRMYWWRDTSSGRFTLADEHQNVHSCRKPGRSDESETTTDDPIVASGSRFDPPDDESDGTPSVPADPMAAVQAAMQEAMQAKMQELGLLPKPVTTTPKASGPGKLGKRSGTWQIVQAAAEHLPRVLLYGPPGTGKTHLAMVAGTTGKDNVYRVNMTEDTPAAELRGHYVPTGAGAWEWQDGPAMRVFRNGGRLVIDEITRATDDALSFTLAILDGHKVTLPTGEHVYPHPDMTVWATTNDGPEALTDALADRFTVRIECNEVNPEALATLPANIAKAVTAGNNGGVSFREAAEYNRLKSLQAISDLSDIVGRDIAAEFIFGQRARDVKTAFEMGEKLQ